MLRRDAPEVYVRRVMVNTAISWRRRRRPLEVPLLTSDSEPTRDAYAQVEERQLPRRVAAVTAENPGGVGAALLRGSQ
ncbi:hypothetical protein NKG94_45480 [Micromonospora sp. M12]